MIQPLQVAKIQDGAQNGCHFDVFPHFFIIAKLYLLETKVRCIYTCFEAQRIYITSYLNDTTLENDRNTK